VQDGETNSRLFVDSIPGIVLLMTPAGDLEVVNRAVTAYFGKTLEQLQHWATDDTVHPADRARVFEVFKRAIASGEPYKFEARFRRFDGVYRWFQCRGLPHRDATGGIVRWYATGIDIDQRKRAEEALRRSEARLAETERDLRLTIDTIPVFVAVYRPDGTRSFVNRTWQDYMGLTLEEATGPGAKTFPHFHPADAERNDRAWRAALATGEPLTIEVRVRRADGRYRWHTSRRVPLRDESGNILRWYSIGIDIEDQKVAEEALRQSEARLTETERELRVTLDSIPTITWRGGANGYVQQLNKRWFEYTGTTPEQVRGWRWKSCVHPDDLDQLVDIGSAYVASGEPFDGEARLRRFDGEYRWFLFRPAPLRDDTGKVIAWYGTITDIEDRKRAEQKAIEAERELQMAIDNIPVLVGIYSADGTRRSVNKRALEVTGLTAEDVPDERWRKAFHPDDVEPVESQWRACLARGEPFEREVRTRAADGTYRRHLTRRVPLRDSDGKVIRWYGIGHDVEDQKRAEEAVAASERNLKLIIDTIPALAWSARLDGSAEFVNQHYIDYVGLSLERLQDWGWTAAVHPDDLSGLASAWQAIRASGQVGEAEARLRRHDGEYRWFLFRASPLRDENGNVVKWYGVNTDIEDRKRAEERIRDTQAELAHMTRVMTMGALTASIAHEVNQPLAGIITNAGTCLRMLAADPPNVEGARETARRTIRDGNRAADVIARLRALFSRKAPATETVDLNEATREVLALVFSDLLRNRVALRVELGDEPLLVLGDRVQLQQVILNLVRNASDAMSDVSNRQRTLLVKADREDEGRARLSVTDAGVGLDPQVAARLFDAFYTTKGDGMGIGLSVSLSIIESHGGKLWAEQNDGPGATFAFSIPRQADNATDENGVGAWKSRMRGDYDVVRNA
jgi:PAS domain S-box-containing protein